MIGSSGGLLAKLLLCAALQAPQPAIVERVEIAKNRTLPKETLLYYVSTKPGERYDERRLRADFRRLLSTGLLDDLKLEVRDGASGKIVVFEVTERQRIQSIEFRGSKALQGRAIEDELRRRGVLFRPDGYYDDVAARKAEAVIREMLEAKGRPDGKVGHETKPAGAASLQLTFTIDDGPKAVVKEIVFTGNRAFSDDQLRGALKALHPSFWSFGWLKGTPAYTREKWDGGDFGQPGDERRLEDFYLSRGYVTASVGQPKLTELAHGERGEKWLRLEIPVVEGEQYRVGELRIEGLASLGYEDVRPLFDLREGDVYDESKLAKGYAKLREMYGRRGFFQATTGTRRTPDTAARIVNVVLAIDEDRRYFVGRIEFTGNTVTRDGVVRRQVLLNEGEVFDTEALKDSLRRLSQVGYFEPMEAPPTFAPNKKTEDTIDLTFKLRERNGTRFNFGGGTSGTEGAYLSAGFSTANFLGMGETFDLEAQTGRLTRNFQISLTEPYFQGRPMSAGFDLFHRRVTYATETDQGVQGYRDQRTGGSVFSGVPVGKWSRLGFGYSFQVVEISLHDVPASAGVSHVSPAYLEDVGTRHESTWSTVLARNTVDSPITPRRGTRLTASIPLTGGPLGGSLDFWKPNLEAVGYLRTGSRLGFGARAQAGWILPFGDTAELNSAGRDRLPFYQLYFLGGENQVRGYDYRTIGPRDANGLAVGGNKFLLLNAEYYIDLVGPLRLVLFYDAGQAFEKGQGLSFDGLRTSTGAELRVVVPILNMPLRVIYAWNLNRDSYHPAHAFKFTIGTTF